MSFFEKVKAKASEELTALQDDARPTDDKVHEYFRLGVLHSKLSAIEEKFKEEVQKLKSDAEAKLREDITQLRDRLNDEAVKIREEMKGL